MIISHKYKYIFIKPYKVAGTSVEIALAKHCGTDDIITPITEYDPVSDSSEYQQPTRNYKEKEFYNHITPEEIKIRIDPEIWKEYFKFTIIRNPWDQVVSRYFWNKHKAASLKGLITYDAIISNVINPRAYYYLLENLMQKISRKLLSLFLDDFEIFLLFYEKRWKNTRYYFDSNENPICDFYLKFENLEDDYKTVCNKLGIPFEKLPLTKNKLRKEKRNFAQYYSRFSNRKLRSLLKKEIEFFSYEFGEV